MKNKSMLSGHLNLQRLLIGAAAGTLALQARAITVDGTLDAGYGSALAVQSVNTQFGDTSYTGTPNGPDANGSELDAAYGVISGGNLYVFLSGAAQNNGNHINIFIADGRSGQSTLNTSVNPLNVMNGSTFSPGFSATFAVDLNDYQGTLYTDAADLVANTGGYQGAVGLSSGIGNGTLSDGITVGLNNSLISSMGASGTAANRAAMLAATTGLELAIPLSLLGNPSGSIEILADINGGGNGYLSNQFLSGLPVGSGNLGTSGFNFGSTPGEFFIVTPEPSTMMLGASGMAALLLLRRRR